MNESDFQPRQRDEARKKRNKKKMRGNGGRTALLIIAGIVVILTAFIIADKFAWPDADLLFFLPEGVHQTVNEQVLGNTTTTTTEAATVTTTAPTTTLPAGHYAPIEDFAFEQKKKGNLLGNILQGGKAWHDSEYIYHIVDCDGIYRFYPGTETFTRIYASPDYLANLNVTDKLLYFTNETDKKLYSIDKNGKSPTVVAENVKTAYIYDNILYYVTYSNLLCKMDLSDGSSQTLYTSQRDEVKLVGISLKRVYFITVDGYGTQRFFTVDNAGSEKPEFFRTVQNVKELLYPVMEDGFLYYYLPNEDGTYNLIRQKFGSEQTVTLVKSAGAANYAVVELNRLFYAHLEGDTYYVKEMNMNDNSKLVRLKADSAAADNSLLLQHGGTYDFIIGYRNDKSWIYFASCSSTSANRVMYFKDGRWSY